MWAQCSGQAALQTKLGRTDGPSATLGSMLVSGQLRFNRFAASVCLSVRVLHSNMGTLLITLSGREPVKFKQSTTQRIPETPNDVQMRRTLLHKLRFEGAAKGPSSQ